MRQVFLGAILALTPLPGAIAAQQSSDDSLGRIRLETSESLFAVLTAINVCGYDAELTSSDPLRAQIRAEASAATDATPEAQQAREALCKLYRSKKQDDSARDLAQFVSLALNLTPSPFTLTMKEADLPPDALDLRDFIPLLQHLYDSAGWQKLYLKHQREYDERVAAVRTPISDLILKTDLYLKMPSGTYLGRKFIVYVDAMGAPAQVNARNYGDDYYLVVTPSAVTVKLDLVRHTYLHYILDPLILKRARQVARIAPLLEHVQTAPMDESFKRDASLLIIESLIRAIEARTLPVAAKDPKAVEAARSAVAQSSMEQGFILTRFFYDQLRPFEREATGIRDAFADMLYVMDVGAERKRAERTVFAKQANAEVVRPATVKIRRSPLLVLAEEKLAKGDVKGARQLAQQVLSEEERPNKNPAHINPDDRGFAMFVLARAATLNRDVDGAQQMFERTIEATKEPRTLAWSHIMLGRILDLRCQRDAALTHYRAALNAGDKAADTQNAANKGIDKSPGSCKEVAEN